MSRRNGTFKGRKEDYLLKEVDYLLRVGRVKGASEGCLGLQGRKSRSHYHPSQEGNSVSEPVRTGAWKRILSRGSTL